MKGRAGAYSFYSSKGRQVVRVAQNSTNYGESARRSEAQQARRVKWANLVNFYKLSASWMRGAFESKNSNETDYNAFMRKNLAAARVALTKEEAAVGACILDTFIISEGSLPSLYVDNDAGVIFTNIVMTTAPTASTTVAEFTNDVLTSNPSLSEGMQISLLDYAMVFGGGAPRTYMHKQELTLSKTNTAYVSQYWPTVTFALNSSNQLQINLHVAEESYLAIILSDSTTGRLRVSSETLHWGDEETAEEYSSEEQLQKAMASYGVDESYFLQSGSGQVIVNPDIKIFAVEMNGQSYGTGSRISMAASATLESLVINCNQPISPEFDISIADKAEGGMTLQASDYNIVGNSIVLTAAGIARFKEEASENALVDQVTVEQPDGKFSLWEITIQRT